MSPMRDASSRVKRTTHLHRLFELQKGTLKSTDDKSTAFDAVKLLLSTAAAHCLETARRALRNGGVHIGESKGKIGGGLEQKCIGGVTNISRKIDARVTIAGCQADDDGSIDGHCRPREREVVDAKCIARAAG